LPVLQHGKHLFLEKPVASDLSQARAIASAADASGKLTLMAFPFRRYSLLLQARERIRNSEPSLMSSLFSVQREGISPFARNDGPLLDLGCHHFDLWRFLLQDEVEILDAHLSDDHALVTARARNRGTLLRAVFSHGDSNIHEFDFHLKEGRLRLDLYRKEGLEFLPSGEFAGDPLARARRALGYVRAVAQSEVATPLAACTEAWNHFAECILNNQPTDCPLSEGIRAMEIYTEAMRVATGFASREAAHA
jgi:myo-inositol 2-dehydrogenase / D-chiro-inositol 1-dehydrogenase